MVCGVLVGWAVKVAWASFHCCIMMLPNSSICVLSSKFPHALLCLPLSSPIFKFNNCTLLLFFLLCNLLCHDRDVFWASSDFITVRLFSHDGPGWHSSPVGSCWFYSAGGGSGATSSTIGSCWFSPCCVSPPLFLWFSDSLPDSLTTGPSLPSTSSNCLGIAVQ